MVSIWDTLWDGILDDMNEIMIYVDSLLSNDRIVYWTVRNLAWALWSGPVFIWWMILALYFQHVVQNIRFDPLTLVITWILFFLSPPRWSSVISHPTERTGFVVDDIFSAWNLLLGPVFLFSLIQTTKNRRQLIKDISDFLTVTLDLDVPWDNAENRSRSGDSDSVRPNSPIRPDSPQPKNAQVEINEPGISPLLDDSDGPGKNIPSPKPLRPIDRFLRDNVRPPFFPARNSRTYIRIEPRKKSTICDQGTQTSPVDWRAYLREHDEPAPQETDDDNAPQVPPSDDDNAFTRRNVSNASPPVGKGSRNDEPPPTEASIPAVVSNVESLSQSPSDENHAVTSRNASNASLHVQEDSFSDETLAAEISMLAIVSDTESVSESEPTREEEMLSNRAPVVRSSAEKPHKETENPQDEVFDQNESENDETTQQALPPIAGTIIFTSAPAVTPNPEAATERPEFSEPQDQVFDQNEPENDGPTHQVAPPMVKTPAFTHAPVVAQSSDVSEPQHAVSKSPEVLEPQDEVFDQKRPGNDEPTEQVAPSTVGTSSSIYAPVYAESSKSTEALKSNNEAQTPHSTYKFGTTSTNAPDALSAFQTSFSKYKVVDTYNPSASSPSKDAPAVSFTSGSSLLNNASVTPTPSQSSLSNKPQGEVNPFERPIINQAQSTRNPFAIPVPNPFARPVPNPFLRPTTYTDSPDGSDTEAGDGSISDVKMGMTSLPVEGDATGVNNPESIGSDARDSATDDVDIEDVALPTTPTLPAINDFPTSPYDPDEDEDIYGCSVAGDISEEEMSIAGSSVAADVPEEEDSTYVPPSNPHDTGDDDGISDSDNNAENDDISDSDNNAEEEDIYDCSVAGDIPEEEGGSYVPPTSPFVPDESDDISDSDTNAEDEDIYGCSVAGDIPADDDADVIDDIQLSIDEFLLSVEPDTGFNYEGPALSESPSAALEALVEERLRSYHDDNTEFNPDTTTVGIGIEDTEMGEAAVEENHALAESTTDIPMEIPPTQEVEMANPVNINTTVPGLGSNIFSYHHTSPPVDTPVAEHHVMTQGNGLFIFTGAENDLEMTESPPAPPNATPGEPVNSPQGSHDMTFNEQLEKDLIAAYEADEMEVDEKEAEEKKAKEKEAYSPEATGKLNTPAEILARPKRAVKSLIGATMNVVPVTQAAPPPQAAPANNANHGLLHLAQAPGTQVAGLAAPSQQTPSLPTTLSGNTGSQTDSMQGLEGIAQDAEILDTEPNSQTPMKKGGFLFPGGNATTPVPAIQVTPREEKPQQKAYVAPIERGGLLLPGGNPVMNSSSTSNNQLATATQSQPDTTPNPKPKENLQKKELDRILRTQERQRNNQPQPLRESPRSQPRSVQRPPQARDRDETLGGPSRMNVVTRSQAALREAVRVASTSSAIAHEAEKQETRDEKE